MGQDNDMFPLNSKSSWKKLREACNRGNPNSVCDRCSGGSGGCHGGSVGSLCLGPFLAILLGSIFLLGVCALLLVAMYRIRAKRRRAYETING